MKYMPSLLRSRMAEMEPKEDLQENVKNLLLLHGLPDGNIQRHLY